MKTILTLTASLLSLTILFAQNKVKGTVLLTNDKPIEIAEIYLMDTKGNLSYQTFTDENGHFELNDITPDQYLFQLYSFGIKHLDKNLEINQDINMGIIKIDNTTALEEIVVNTQQKVYERKIDRTIFNIENTVHATNNDATDLLKLTPGLKVDSENISMIGKSNMRVMINERMVQLSGEALLNYLKTLPSENIKKIEVITVPPAKYEAEGNSGLINIVLKEAKENAWSNQISSGFKASDKATWRFSDVFNYNKNKVSINAGLNGTTGYSQVFEHSTLDYPNETWEGTNRRTRDREGFSGNFQIDYQLTDNATIGGQYFGGKSTPGETDRSVYDVNNFVDNYLKYIKTTGKNTDNVNNHAANIHYIQKFDTVGTKLNIDLDYFVFNSDRTRVFNTFQQYVDNVVNNPYKAKSMGDQNIENYSVNIDMEQPLKWFKLSYGAKASFVKTTNKTNFFDLSSGTPIEDIKQKDNFEYKENTQALYINGSKEFNDKWQAQVGLRLETTQTTGTSNTYATKNTKDYTKVFPTVYVTYNKNDDNTFSMSYNKRISRPGFWELNPFRWYINEFNYVEGNPEIQPAYTDNIEFTHTYKSKLTTTISFSKTKNIYSQYSLINPETNTQVHLRDNIFDSSNFNASISYVFNTFSWLQSQNSLYTYYSDYKLIKDLPLPTKSSWGTYFTTNNTVQLNSEKTLQAQVDFWISPPFKTNMYDVETGYSLSLGLKYALLDKKLNLSLYVNDILNTSSQDFKTSSNGVKQSYNVYYDNRYVNFGLSYVFGNSKIKVKEHQGGNKEEQNRK